MTILYLFRLADPNSADGAGQYRPKWSRDLLRDEPALLADVLRRSAGLKLETGLQPAAELRELANAEDHRGIAELVSLSLLEGFPKAETEAALMSLCWLLNAALMSCDWPKVGSVIEERLGTGGQEEAEHGCWLAAGYLVAPERFREDLRSLAKDGDGLKWLARFVTAGRLPMDFTRRFTTGDFEPLVAAMGAALRLHGLPERAYWATADVIATLGGDPSAAATETLEALTRMPDAKPWSPAIANAKERQARKRREHEYRHSDLRQVVRTLDNAAPANAGDLAALVSLSWRTSATRFATGTRRTGANTGTSMATAARRNPGRRTHAGTRCCPTCRSDSVG